MNNDCDMVRRASLVLLLASLLVGCGGEPGPSSSALDSPHRLFPNVPEWARDRIPMSQVDFATAHSPTGSSADQSAKDEKDAGRSGDPSAEAQRRIERFFSQIVGPGWHLDGWVCQLHFSECGPRDQRWL